MQSYSIAQWLRMNVLEVGPQVLLLFRSVTWGKLLSVSVP